MSGFNETLKLAKGVRNTGRPEMTAVSMRYDRSLPGQNRNAIFVVLIDLFKLATHPLLLRRHPRHCGNFKILRILIQTI